MLDERKTAILRAVVQEYIETAQPVGSGHVAARRGVRVSAGHRPQRDGRARAGGLPRASPTPRPAGSRPTRVTASSSTTSPTPAGSTRAQGGAGPRVLRRRPRRLEQMLQETSRLLAGLTDYAAVVIGPSPRGRARCAQSQLVGLSGRVAMVVAVLSNGTVESHHLELDDDVTEAAGAAPRPPTCGMHLVGHAAEQLPTPVPSSGDDAVDRLCDGGRRRAPAPPPATTRTTSSSAAPRRMAAAFDAVEVVRKVLQTLEQQYVVVSLLRDVLDRGLSVAIGAEHGVEPLVGVLGGGGALRRRGRARRHGRRARPDPHELPAGAGHRRGRQRAPRAPADATARFGAAWPTTTSCSACAGGASADEIKRPTATRRASCTPTPTRTTRRRGAVQGGGPGLRGAVRPRPAGPLRPLRRGRRRRVPRAAASTPSFGAGGLGDLFERVLRRRAPFGGRAGPTGPPRGQDLEVVVDADLRAGRVRRHRAGDRAHRRGLRRRAAAPAPPRARSRSPAPSAPAPARCAGSARACSARW